MNQEFASIVEEIIKDTSFSVKIQDKNIRLYHKIPRYHLNFEVVDQEIYIYIYIRITSWDPYFPNDRSDVHEILSSLLSIFLRTTCNYTSSLIDIDHPYLDEPPVYIYGSYVVLTQTRDFKLILNNEINKVYLKELIEALDFFGFIFPKILGLTGNGMSNSSSSYEKAEPWAKKYQ